MNNKIKIIGLPFAGGNMYSYQMYEKILPTGFEWRSIDLPGHGARMQEKLVSDFDVLADDIFEQIKGDIISGEYLIYGHSMGTILAYELMKRIIKQGYRLPICLFMTGREAPSVLEKDRPTDLDSEGFWNYIKEKGGLPKGLLEDKDVLAFFEPILRADFNTIVGYKFEALPEPLPVPIFVQIGDEEDITNDELMAWQELTILPLEYQIVKGDHFFINDNPQRVLDAIVEASQYSKKMV